MVLLLYSLFSSVDLNVCVYHYANYTRPIYSSFIVSLETKHFKSSKFVFIFSDHPEYIRSFECHMNFGLTLYFLKNYVINIEITLNLYVNFQKTDILILSVSIYEVYLIIFVFFNVSYSIFVLYSRSFVKFIHKHFLFADEK